MTGWQKHHEDIKNYPPSRLLVEAVPFMLNKHKALDLGAAVLTDTKFLLSEGFEVIALDKEKGLEEISDPKFKFVHSTYSGYSFPKNVFDLVNAQYSLPFNGKETFPELWANILNSLKSEGIFVGQFFGENDGWNVPGSEIAFHTISEVNEMLKDMEVLKLIEVDKDRHLSDGTPKHWHVYNVIAKKRVEPPE